MSIGLCDFHAYMSLRILSKKDKSITLLHLNKDKAFVGSVCHKKFDDCIHKNNLKKS